MIEWMRIFRQFRKKPPLIDDDLREYDLAHPIANWQKQAIAEEQRRIEINDDIEVPK